MTPEEVVALAEDMMAGGERRAREIVTKILAEEGVTNAALSELMQDGITLGINGGMIGLLLEMQARDLVKNPALAQPTE